MFKTDRWFNKRFLPGVQWQHAKSYLPKVSPISCFIFAQFNFLYDTFLQPKMDLTIQIIWETTNFFRSDAASCDNYTRPYLEGQIWSSGDMHHLEAFSNSVLSIPLNCILIIVRSFINQKTVHFSIKKVKKNKSWPSSPTQQHISRKVWSSPTAENKNRPCKYNNTGRMRQFLGLRIVPCGLSISSIFWGT